MTSLRRLIRGYTTITTQTKQKCFVGFGEMLKYTNSESKSKSGCNDQIRQMRNVAVQKIHDYKLIGSDLVTRFVFEQKKALCFFFTLLCMSRVTNFSLSCWYILVTIQYLYVLAATQASTKLAKVWYMLPDHIRVSDRNAGDYE